MPKIQIKRGTAPIGTQLDTGEFGFKTDTVELVLGRGIGQPGWRVSLWNEYAAQSILAAVTAGSPSALTIAEQRVVGRLTGGNVAALTGADLWTILNGQAGTDISFNAKRLTNVADPTANQDAATKSYVDSVATGLSVKQAVACATTENITLFGEQMIDGVMTSSSRVLVKNQTNAAQNGIYISSSGAWSRAPDMDTASEFPHSFVFVTNGTTQKDTGWVCTNEPEGIVVGTTSITFAQFSGAGYVSAGTGLSKSGNVISVTGGLADIAGISPVKGRLLVGNGTNWVSLSVGANNEVLTADSSTATGLKWAPGGGGGSTTFLGLTDTPSSYSGAANYLLAVNSGANAVEFINVVDGGTLA